MNGVRHLESGRYVCPVSGCTARFHSVSEKKRHIHTEHADSRKQAKP